MSGRPWTRAEIAILRRDYPNTDNRQLAWRLRRSVRTIYLKAANLGVKKTHAYLAAAAARRAVKQTPAARSGHFKPGMTPWNLGVKGYRCSPRTEFKKGARPHTWKSIGTERLSKEGYRQRKVTDTGYPPRDWRSLHVMLWEETHGPVPSGHAVIFKDGDKTHIELANLELVSRRELMRRNSYTNYPPEIARLIQLRGAVQRQINKRERDAKQN